MTETLNDTEMITVTLTTTQNPEHAMITNVCPSTTDGVCNTSGFKSGEKFNVMITIKNTGDIAGTNGYSVRLFDGSTKLKAFGMGAIAPGSSKVVYFAGVVMPAHAYNLDVKVYDRVAGVTSPHFNHSMSFTVPYIPPVDPCAGITCPNTCDGTSLYAQKCVNGHCVKDPDALIETNSPTCGYVAPAVCPNVTASVTLVSKTDLIVTVDVQTTPSIGWMANDPHLDWGDNEGLRPVSNGHHSHTYASPGRYNIQMGGGLLCGHANSDYIYVDVIAPAPVTCTGSSPHYGDGCTMLKHYDANNDGAISMLEYMTAINDLKAGIITQAEHDFIKAAYLVGPGGINAKCSGCCDPCAGITCDNTCDGTSLYAQKCVNGHCVKDPDALIETNSPTCGYVAPTPAQGQLEELDYPASLNHGADMRVTFKIHNTGGSTGTFIARLYQGSTKVGIDWRDVVHAGNSSSGAITVKAPTTGTSVSYTLKLFKEIS